MDKLEDFYEPPLCEKCGKVMDVTKSREEWGIEVTLECGSCGHDVTNLIKG